MGESKKKIPKKVRRISFDEALDFATYLASNYQPVEDGKFCHNITRLRHLRENHWYPKQIYENWVKNFKGK